MNPFLSTLILLAGLNQASSSATSSSNDDRQVMTAQRQTMVLQQKLAGELALPEQNQENVLVVPTPALPPESIAQLTDDMNVMCWIFNKAVLPARLGVGFVYGDRSDVFLGSGDWGTQGLYLEGYGALFFLRVDYPLVSTERNEPAQPKAQEPGDPVWAQTINEMSGKPTEEPPGARKAQAYDPQKVENLKKTLIRTLAHASNIRMGRPQDAITLVVGALDEAKASAYGRFRGTGLGRSTARSGVGAGAAAQPATRNPAAPLLILRVTKADVDAFAKSQLTLAQFTEKVQILFSPGVPSAPATSATGPTPVSTRR